MCLAYIAHRFYPLHSITEISMVGNGIILNRLCKRRPSGTGFKLSGSIKQQGITADAGISAGLKQAAHFAAECPLCTFFAGNLVLFRAKHSSPFLFAPLYNTVGLGIAFFGKLDYVFPG
jgi:hypothetical protein